MKSLKSLLMYYACYSWALLQWILIVLMCVSIIGIPLYIWLLDNEIWGFDEPFEHASWIAYHS